MKKKQKLRRQNTEYAETESVGRFFTTASKLRKIQTIFSCFGLCSPLTVDPHSRLGMMGDIFN